MPDLETSGVSDAIHAIQEFAGISALEFGI
jgi:hypothetical protein